MPFNPPNYYNIKKIIKAWNKEEEKEERCKIIRAAAQDTFSELGYRTPGYSIILERCTKGPKTYYWVLVADERGGVESMKTENFSRAESKFEQWKDEYGARDPLKETDDFSDFI